MTQKERYIKYNEIAERAMESGIYTGQKINLLMDIESADLKFHLELEQMLSASISEFAHDILGIVGSICRDKFPATDFGTFVPRFAA